MLYSEWGVWWIMNLRACGRKRTQPNLKYYSSICPNFSYREDLSLAVAGWDFNLWPPQCEVEGERWSCSYSWLSTTSCGRMGEFRYARILNLDTKWKWAFNFSSRLLYWRGKTLTLPLDRGLGDINSPYGRGWWKKYPCFYRESNPGRPSCTVVIILTEVSRLSLIVRCVALHWPFFIALAEC
jgi:hypothetical protein